VKICKSFADPDSGESRSQSITMKCAIPAKILGVSPTMPIESTIAIHGEAKRPYCGEATSTCSPCSGLAPATKKMPAAGLGVESEDLAVALNE